VGEARASLLGLGRDVEVVSPTELRAEMARVAREVAELYRSDLASQPA
jgi:predicted DNA-binding transcriptional regulator YafY